MAFSLAAVPAFAGQHQRRPGSGEPAERAVPRDEPKPAPAPAQRTEPQRQPEPQRTEPRRAPEPRRSDSNPPHTRSTDRAIPRTEPYRAPDNRNRGNRPTILTPRYYNSGRYFTAPYRGYRPYAFRPQTRIRSFDIYIGYPVPYAYSYSYPVPIYGYGRAMSPVTVGPASPYYGGISLELWPSHAEVFVDGTYAGWVEDFDGTMQPLTLMAGTHRIEVIAPGYEPLVLDVFVRAGEVIPYRGNLVRY